MKIDRDVVAHLEKLARLHLAQDEVEQITQQLNDIIEFVEKLQSVDTSGVAPTGLISHGSEEHLRADEVRPGLDRDEILAQAPDHTSDFFRVPRVIDKGDA